MRNSQALLNCNYNSSWENVKTTLCKKYRTEKS